MGTTELRNRVAELVNAATDGGVPVADALAGGSLIALGVDSLGMLRLVDAIEAEYGVEVEFHGTGRRLDTLDDVVAVLAGTLPGGPVGAGTVTGTGAG